MQRRREREAHNSTLIFNLQKQPSRKRRSSAPVGSRRGERRNRTRRHEQRPGSRCVPRGHGHWRPCSFVLCSMQPVAVDFVRCVR